MTRKEFIMASMGLGAVVNGFSLDSTKASQNPLKRLAMLDHVLLGVPDLEKGIQIVKDKTGVEAMFGGKHPNMGTHNALLSLGDGHYLEIIAPVPGDTITDRYAFMKDLKEPVLFTWAAHTDNMENVLKQVNLAGYQNSGIMDGSRLTKEGKKLSWRSLGLNTSGDSLVPFFIEWGKETIHPSVTSPKGCLLQSFEITHPKPKEVETILKNIGLPLMVQAGVNPLLRMTIQSPKGIVTF